MSSPSGDRVSLLLVAPRGKEEALREHVRRLADEWAATLGPDASVRATARRPVSDLGDTHWRELLPDLRPYDAALDAWAPAGLDGVDSLGALRDGLVAPAVDVRRSRILVGRETQVKEGHGPFVVSFLQHRAPGFTREGFVTYLHERHVRIEQPDDAERRPVMNRLTGFGLVAIDAERTASAAAATGLAAAPFDTLSEPRYETVAHFREVTCDPALRVALTADEQHFVDHERSAVATADTVATVNLVLQAACA